MEHATCNIVYVDRNVREDRHLTVSSATSAINGVEWESEHIAENAKLLLDVFGEVHLCSTGGACLTQWLNLQDTSMIDMKPTIFLIDTPFEDRLPERSRSRTPSPHSPPDEETHNHEEELYGLALLQRIVSESYLRNLSKLVVPVPLIVFPRADRPDSRDSSSDVREEIASGKLHPGTSKNRRAANRRMLKKCLDLGATDVMASPMNGKCITNLEVHAYRSHRQAARDQKALLEVRRGRKRSWVGISEEKPFAYLREAMVSNLMNKICLIESEVDDAIHSIKISVPAETQARIARAVAEWHFCAHDFSEDELITAAAIMFKHAFSMPELDQWRIPTDQLHTFLIACQAAYNSIVPYHNFRHVVDVLQATFNFLVHIGALPPYPPADKGSSTTPIRTPLAQLLCPFDALTLLVTAIGHDVGHPGVNNPFLVKLNAPLAQLYNDRSVLESFHCAAYSQILRRHWPSVFHDNKMRDLMISSILATDMGLHFDYMQKMATLQAKLRENNTTDGWDARTLGEQKALVCALLIKCADVSNVAREYRTAVQWMHILSDEFSRQADMEAALGIPTSLAVPPKKDMISLANSQKVFMGLFAIPLFQGVADILPAMQYCVDELEMNRQLFEKCMADEQAKVAASKPAFSPKSTGSAITPEQQSDTPLAKDSPLASSASEDRSSTEKAFMPQPADPVTKPTHIPETLTDFKEVNGIGTSFDPAADFAQSDEYNPEDECKPQPPTKQRCSETTESSSVPCTGDWASQATSATTGKMPLSPSSTRGTSILSRYSLERPTSVPVTTITAAESTTTATESARSQPELKLDGQPLPDEGPSINGHSNGLGKTPESPEVEPGKSLKKKPSRFRINALPFFRRHKSPSPSVRAADTAG